MRKFPHKLSCENAYKFASTIPCWKLPRPPNDRWIFTFQVNDIYIPLESRRLPTHYLGDQKHSFKGLYFGSSYTGEIINSLHSQTLRISSKPIHTSEWPVFVHKPNTQWPAAGCMWGLLGRWGGQATGKPKVLSALSHYLTFTVFVLLICSCRQGGKAHGLGFIPWSHVIDWCVLE